MFRSIVLLSSEKKKLKQTNKKCSPYSSLDTEAKHMTNATEMKTHPVKGYVIVSVVLLQAVS